MSRVLRWLLIAVGLALAVVLLFTIVFPWFDRTFVDDPTMDASPAEVEAVG